MDYKNHIQNYINQEIDILKKLDLNRINDVLNEIITAYERESTIYIFGNGGSASTASHFVNDFNKGISEYTEKKFRFVCLSDNMSTLTAIANDIGYEDVFAFQLRGRLKDTDLVIGISGSGNSKNIIHALQYANEIGAKTIGLTGYDGGKVASMVDVSLNVPVCNMQITEDIHMILDHLIMSVLYKVWGIKGH